MTHPKKVRNLISHIVIHPADEGLNIELHGHQAMILDPQYDARQSQWILDR